MSDSWDDRRRAKEEEFFAQENKAAMSRLKSRDGTKPRLSPITGEPMEQITVMGVVVDRCKTSGGIWLDAGELEQILNEGKKEGPAQSGFLANFLSTITGKG